MHSLTALPAPCLLKAISYLRPLEIVRLTKTQSIFKQELGSNLNRSIEEAAEFIGLNPKNLNDASEQFILNMVILQHLLKETLSTIDKPLFPKETLRLFLLHFNNDLDANQTIQFSEDKKTITLTQSPPITIFSDWPTISIMWGNQQGIIATYNQNSRSLESVYIGKVAPSSLNSPIPMRHGKGQETFFMSTSFYHNSLAVKLISNSGDTVPKNGYKAFLLLKLFCHQHCNFIAIYDSSFFLNEINIDDPQTKLNIFYTETNTILNSNNACIDSKCIDYKVLSHPKILSRFPTNSLNKSLL